MWKQTWYLHWTRRQPLFEPCHDWLCNYFLSVPSLSPEQPCTWGDEYLVMALSIIAHVLALCSACDLGVKARGWRRPGDEGIQYSLFKLLWIKETGRVTDCLACDLRQLKKKWPVQAEERNPLYSWGWRDTLQSWALRKRTEQKQEEDLI